MTNYILREEQGVSKSIECESIRDVLSAADDWAHEGDYGDIESTIWVDTQIIDEYDNIISVRTTSIHPDEPNCESINGHDWQSPIELVGGIKENPGIFGHGGGVFITEACVNCGCKRTTDTWAQRPDNGVQGLTSIKYEPKAYDLSELE